ncbi:MAG TPA: metallophosphoesterase [Desulfomonilia bacterium]
MRRLNRAGSFSVFLLVIILPFLLMLTVVSCKPTCDFSIAVIADPHCSGSLEHWDRMDKAISWINENRAAEKIDLVVIVGDMAWGGNNLSIMKGKLDGLAAPYIPVIGDNEIHGGDEAVFDDVFSSQFDKLALLFADSWNKAPAHVMNPQTDKEMYLENYSFDYKGLHIVCADWNTRNNDGGVLEPEQAELYDFEGGTWPWFKEDILASTGRDKESILVFSHHPMHVSPVYPLTKMDLGAFSYEDFKTITSFTLPLKDYIYASYAGHYHVPMQQDLREGGYKVYVTRALHQPRQLEGGNLLKEPTIKLINVTKKDGGFTYRNQLVFTDQGGQALVLDEDSL